MMNRQMTLGEKIKTIRKEAGLTQGQLAEKCGLSIAAIRHIEQGIRNPSFDVLQKIASVCGKKFEVVFSPIAQ